MIDIENYITKLLDDLKISFGSRLLYLGLQGSYLRGEATENSDIDIMVIIDKLSVSDLNVYRSIIQALDHFDKSCGFICSKDDLAKWNPLEICHVLHSTKDYYGQLIEWIPPYTVQDIRNFLKLSINNLYHELCHRYIHANATENAAHLPGTYKSVFFVLQNLYYLTHGRFICKKDDLLPLLTGKDHEVLKRSIALSSGIPCDFTESFELLLTWCQETLYSI